MIHQWMKANLPLAPVIIEIGAHHAEDTERFFAMFPAAKIMAFEADPRNVPVIESKRLAERFDFTLVAAAVGGRTGETTFYLSGGDPKGDGGEWTLSSSIRKPKLHTVVHPGVKFVGECTVPMVSLDDYLTDERPIDFIWCDVQGAEADVIRGATKTLVRTRYLFTEFDNRELYEGQINLASIKSMLPEFVQAGIFENNVLLRNMNG